MSNVIQFLESIGRKPLSAVEYAVSVLALDIDSTQRQALLGRDHDALNYLLDSRKVLLCAVFADEGGLALEI